MGTGHPSVKNLHEKEIYVPIWGNTGRDPFNHNSNRSDWEKWSTSKGGSVFLKLFQLDQTDPLSFGPKFPEIWVEWIAPTNVLVRNIIIVISINQIVSPAYTNLTATEESGSKKHL